MCSNLERSAYSSRVAKRTHGYESGTDLLVMLKLSADTWYILAQEDTIRRPEEKLINDRTSKVIVIVCRCMVSQ